MLQFTKRTAFFLVALNLLAPAASAATFHNGELGTMWDRTDATLFNNARMNGAGDQSIRAPLADMNWHLSSHLSGKPTGAFFVQKTVVERNAAWHGKPSPAETREPLHSSAIPASAAATAADIRPEYSSKDALVMHSSPLGPIPGPSLKWLVIGALVALVGISRGTRGIHESV